jgi:hypothetical protein
MLFGKISSDKVTEEFDFVEKDIEVYPSVNFVYDIRKEGESVFACMAMPNQVVPPNVIGPEGCMYALLAIPKAKAIIVDRETRAKQSLDRRVTFVRILLTLFNKQTEAFMKEMMSLSFEPFINPFSMNSLFFVINSVVEDMSDLLGVDVILPDIKIQIQKNSPILGADGNVVNSGAKIIC